MQTHSRALEVGQVWSFKNSPAQLAIVGLSRNLVEVSCCRAGKVVKSRSANVQSRRTIRALLANGHARVTGQLVFPDPRLLAPRRRS